ncbi:MAG: DUF1559 domain-containing protein [Planctomycetaceae bacterium]|jgi:prepilin-type processing-associated H-X9-DG protein|nr:DUF1559 domain-containing protein [Planctomycetaceae bacterium]
MKTHIQLLLVMLASLLTLPAFAQDDFTLEKMKPLLGDDTVIVVHIDFTKLDPEAILNNNRETFQKILKDVGLNEEEFIKLVQNTSPTISQDSLAGQLTPATWKRLLDWCEGGKRFLTDLLGIKDAFLVVQSGKFPLFAYAAIPVDGLNVTMLDALLKENELVRNNQLAAREEGGYYYVTFLFGERGNFGDKRYKELVAAKLGSGRTAERAEFLAAYAEVKDSPVQILYAPPEYVKKVLKEVPPTLPESFLKAIPSLRGKIDFPKFVSALRFKAVGLNPEQGSLHAVAEAESELDAQILASQGELILKVAADGFLRYLESLKTENEKPKAYLPPVSQMLLTLYPEVVNEESLTRLRTAWTLKPEGKRFTVDWNVGMIGENLSQSGILLGKLLQVNFELIQQNAKKSRCANNLKQLTLAMHNYHDSHLKLPPAFTVDKDGKPLHSWRVLLLPYLEHTALYKSIRLEEPWDSEHNKQFHNQMPDLFRCPSCTAGDPKRDTAYGMIVGDKAPGRTDGKGLDMSKITDGTSNTICFAERKTPVCWMAPEDIAFDEAVKGINQGPDGIGSEHPGGVNVSLYDGSVRFFRQTIELDVLRALITHAGGESVSVPRN